MIFQDWTGETTWLFHPSHIFQGEYLKHRRSKPERVGDKDVELRKQNLGQKVKNYNLT